MGRLLQRRRLHSALGYSPPIEHEQAYYDQIDPGPTPSRENSPPVNPGRFMRSWLASMVGLRSDTRVVTSVDVVRSLGDVVEHNAEKASAR